MRLTSAAVLALCFALPRVLIAQDSSTQAKPPRMCFRGGPVPRCSGFWLTEFGVAPRLTPDGRDDGPLYTWELGLMKNAGRRNALGGSFFIEGADDGAGWGIRPRYRHWLSSKFSVEVAPGFVLRHSGYTSVAFSGQVAINFSDYLALTTTLRVFQHTIYLPAFNPQEYPNSYLPASRTSAALFGGVRVGSVPGVITGIGVPLAVFVVFLIACGGGGCFD
jgi:hypothetical protein